MPNQEGRYGGYRKPDPRAAAQRKVRAPGSGTVRRVTPPAEEHYHARRPATQPRRPAHPTAARPSRPVQPAGNRPPRRPMSEEQARAMARRAREQRRMQMQLLLIGTVCAILLLAGVITLVLPDPKNEQPAELGPSDALSVQLVAPIPYETGGTGAEVALDWGFVGPIQQTPGEGQTYTYTAAPQPPAALPECGRVETAWFADAAFLGDSLTNGLSVYGINVGGATVLGYEGTSPNQIVNRTTLNNTERGEEVPLDVLAATQPAKLYVLLGTNALGGTGNDEGFLNYYGRMLDELRAALPNTMVFVQSVLPVRPSALEKFPGLAPDRLANINAGIQALCAERGMYYLNVAEIFQGEDGALLEEYAQPDGIHLTVSGYNQWISYLCTHLPYNKNYPYQAGSTWYLDDSLKELLQDLP